MNVLILWRALFRIRQNREHRALDWHPTVVLPEATEYFEQHSLHEYYYNYGPNAVFPYIVQPILSIFCCRLPAISGYGVDQHALVHSIPYKKNAGCDRKAATADIREQHNEM